MRQRITFKPQRGEDFQCVVLGALGFSADNIGQQCGLSRGQVYYRMRKAGLRLRDYRDGRTPVAKAVVRHAKGYAVQVVRKVLVAHIEP